MRRQRHRITRPHIRPRQCRPETALGRRRPERVKHRVPFARRVRMPKTRSFPSGHAASGFAFATGVASAAPVAGGLLTALAALVAYSRVHTECTIPRTLPAPSSAPGCRRSPWPPPSAVESRHPDPKRARPDREPKRRGELHCLAVDAGVHGRWRIHLEGACGPRPPRRTPVPGRRVDDDDSETSAVELRTGAARRRSLQRVGVVRHQHDHGIGVPGAEIVHQVEPGTARLGPRTA